MNPNSPWRRRLFAFGTLLGGALFVWQTVEAIRALGDSGFEVLSYGWIFAGAIGVVVVTFLQITAWRAIMRSLGVQLSWSATIRGYMLPFVSRYIPGTVWGYLSRSHWMMERHQVPARTVNVGAMIEILAFLISAALVTGVLGALGQVVSIASIGLVCGLAMLSGVVLTQFLSTRGGMVDGLFRRLRIEGWVRDITFKRVAVALPWHFGMWLGHGFVIGCLLSAVSRWDGAFLPIVAASFPLAWIGGFVVVVLPAGLGLREYGIFFVLSQYAAISQLEASTVAVMSRVGVLFGEISFLLLALAFEHNEGSQKASTLRDQDV